MFNELFSLYLRVMLTCALGHMITIQIKKLNIEQFKKINVQKVYYTSTKKNISILNSLRCALGKLTFLI
jgi:hypothetical protein